MIDPKKQYRTRDGREVRIYAVDGVEPLPVHGAINMGHVWKMAAWPRDGKLATSEYDLTEVKPRIQREVWVNVYRPEGIDEYACYYDTRAKADRDDAGRIACVRLVIDCEEGEGL